MRMSVLVRPKGSISGADRVAKLLEKPIFAEVVEAAGGVEAVLAARVAVVEGDLADVPTLPTDIDAVVHCAGDVSFDPPVDEGFTTNVIGVRDLLDRIDEAQAESGRDIHYVHISTAYVAGRRRGSIPEASGRARRRPRDRAGVGPRAAPGGRVPLPRRRRPDQGAQEGREGAQPGRAAHRRPRDRGRAQAVGQGRAGPDRHRAGPQPRAGPTATRSPRRWASGSSSAGPTEPDDHAPRLDRPAEHHRVRPRAPARRAGSRASRWPSR